MRNIQRRLIRVAAAGFLAATAVPLVAGAGPATFHIRPIQAPATPAGGAFGGAVTGIGDVNGDGAGDLVVAALGQEKVYVFSGSDRTLIRAILDPDGLTGMRFGLDVTAVGDVDGDGVEDLGVGSPGDDLAVPLPCVDPQQPCKPDPVQGRAFVFSGASGALLRRLLPPGTNFLAFGFAVAPLGDVNGDGVIDIAVGSPTRRNNKFGQVFAFSGVNGALLWTAAEPAPQALASFGQFLEPIDDVNGDGRRDLLATAPFHDADPDPAVTVLAGKVYVLSGATGAVVRTHDNPSPADGDRFGFGLSALEDETGDGADEYALSDPVAGTVFVHRGNDGAFIRSFTSPGNPATDFFGYPLVRVDDVDGDGLDDVWVGASRGGAVYLMTPTGGTIAQVGEPTPGTPSPPVPEGGFGWALASTADLGGDGLRDLLAGEHGEPVGANAMAGAAYLVVNNRPPVAVCMSLARSADASCLAAVAPEDVDAGSSDPDGDPITLSLVPAGPFLLGTTSVVLTVTDSKGASDSCAATVTVVDDTPPVITGVQVSPPVLWPPNHRMVGVTVGYDVTDNCTTSAAISCGLGVTSSEPDDASGDGHTSPDSKVVDAHHARLRAERLGSGAGRIYTVAISCSDAAGNGASASTAAAVPHNR